MTADYHLMMYARLKPRTAWTGGRITGIDNVTLDDAARFASKHAGVEILPADFLRAAARGEISLRACCPRTVTMQPRCETDEPLHIVENSLPTLPLAACKALSNGRPAQWRTYEEIKIMDAFFGKDLCRFTRWELPKNEPDLITTAGDCRVTGRDVHALADAYLETPAQDTKTPAPQVTESASDTPTTGRIMKLSALIAELEFEWSTVRKNIREATRNGLKDAAHSGKYGMWDCEKARAWAVSMGKIKRDTPVHSLTGAWAGSITRNKIDGR